MTDQWSCPHCREKDAQIAEKDRLLKELKDMLDIVTDLADHRWKALNEIYESEDDDYGYVEWAKKVAARGLHLKK